MNIYTSLISLQNSYIGVVYFHFINFIY